MTRWLYSASVLIAVSASLSGCGGGGGSGPDNPASRGTFTLAATALTFNTTDELVTPPPQLITGSATGLSGDRLFIRIEFSGTAIANVMDVLLTSDSTGQATVVPASASQLGAGTYTGTITVRACTSSPTCQTAELAGSPRTVNVTYNISGVKPAPNSLSYAFGNAPADADRRKTLTISGFPSQTWSASASEPWVQLSTTSGNTTTANTLEVAILAVPAQALKNGTHTAQVTLTPQQGRPFTIPVTLTLDRTQVNFVSPSTVVSGDSHEVVIHGHLFDAATISGIAFGGSAATAFNVVGSNEIRATFPASLTAGEHPVTLQGAAAAAVSLANLAVVEPAAFNAKLVTGSDFPCSQPTEIIYDAKRQQLYRLCLRASVTVFPYLGNDNWSNGTLVTDLGSIPSIALSTDGNTLLFGSKPANVGQALGYAPLNGVGPTVGYGYSFGDAQTAAKSLAVANDGRVVIVSRTEAGGSLRSAWSLTSRNPALDSTEFRGPQPPLTQLSVPGATDPNVFFDGVVGASADGSRVLLASGTAAPGTPHVYAYNPRTGALTDTGSTLKADSIRLNRNGSRVLLNHAILYDGNLQLIGQLPAGTVAATFSPDGSKLYAYGSNEHIKQLNADTLAEENDWAASDSTGDPLDGVVMTISPDGATLFILGTDGILIEPIQ